MVQQVKDPGFSLQWHGSLLWHGFNPWPRSFHMSWTWPRKKNVLQRVQDGGAWYIACTIGFLPFPEI